MTVEQPRRVLGIMAASVKPGDVLVGDVTRGGETYRGGQVIEVDAMSTVVQLLLSPSNETVTLPEFERVQVWRR